MRTLPHYGRIGLVRPAGRTSTGHRLYTAGDVERLYQVLALRQPGLGLDRIADLLAGTVAMTQVRSAHRDYLAAQLAATQELHAPVAALAAKAENRPNASADRFLELIRRTVMVDDTFKEYFTEGQLTQLAQRREDLGEEHIRQAEAGWAVLIPKVDAAIAAGVDPASREAQQMAERSFIPPGIRARSAKSTVPPSVRPFRRSIHRAGPSRSHRLPAMSRKTATRPYGSDRGCVTNSTPAATSRSYSDRKSSTRKKNPTRPAT